MSKTYSHDEVLAELKKLVAETSQTEVSRRLGIGLQMVNDLVRGRRDVSQRVADALGFERKIIFRKKAA